MVELTFIEITKIIKWQIVSGGDHAPLLIDCDDSRSLMEGVSAQRFLVRGCDLAKLRHYGEERGCIASGLDNFALRAALTFARYLPFLRLMTAGGHQQMTLIKLIMKMETCRFHPIPLEKNCCPHQIGSFRNLSEHP